MTFLKKSKVMTFLQILLYSCKILGSENIDLSEKLHIKFCRHVLNVKSYTPNYMIYGELGRFLVMYFLTVE